MNPHSLQQLTALRVIRFTVDARYACGGVLDLEAEVVEYELCMTIQGTMDVVESLRTIHRSPALPTLALIEVVFQIPFKYQAQVDFVKEAEWQELGNILADLRFRSVAKIEVVLELTLITTDVDLKAITFLEDFPRRWKESYPSIPLRIRTFERYLVEEPSESPSPPPMET